MCVVLLQHYMMADHAEKRVSAQCEHCIYDDPHSVVCRNDLESRRL